MCLPLSPGTHEGCPYSGRDACPVGAGLVPARMSARRGWYSYTIGRPSHMKTRAAIAAPRRGPTTGIQA